MNQLNTRKRKLDKKKIRIMAGRKEGCTKDYVLVFLKLKINKVPVN